MAITDCQHPSLLSESQDWYRKKEPTSATKAATGYPTEKRHPQLKRSYIHKIFAARRRRLYDEVIAQLVADPPAPLAKIEQRFLEEAGRWDRETAYLSSTPKMVLHDSYQKIIAMGPDVVPYLLRDLEQNRRSWFWALRYLTNANPVPPEDQGNLDKMIAAWLAWARREGRI
jgi:hypothetical protein